MKWSTQAWEQISPIYDEIINNRFNVALLSGTLSKARFNFYIQQDAYYLKDYGKTLATIAAKLNEEKYMQAFLDFARSAILVENALHEDYLTQMENFPKVEVSPTCMLYKSFLSAQLLNEPIEVALAAVLPCFWIYKMVGDEFLSKAKLEEHPYKAWILTYGSEEFAASVITAIEVCDHYAAQTTPEIRAKMTQAFVLASKMEWYFWDTAYAMESWKV